jgi:hypothetical protein
MRRALLNKVKMVYFATNHSFVGEDTLESDNKIDRAETLIVHESYYKFNYANLLLLAANHRLYLLMLVGLSVKHARAVNGRGLH